MVTFQIGDRVRLAPHITRGVDQDSSVGRVASSVGTIMAIRDGFEVVIFDIEGAGPEWHLFDNEMIHEDGPW